MPECPNCFELKDRIKALQEEISTLKQVTAPSWKGSTEPIIQRLNNTEWLVIITQKHDRESEPHKTENIVPHNKVLAMWEIILRLTDANCNLQDRKPINGEKCSTEYKEVKEELIKKYKQEGIDITLGNEEKIRNLGMYYFTDYLYPLYVLQHLNYIYFPRKIWRLKN